MPNIVIFASGNGSNAEVIVSHFQNHPNIKVTGILSNKPEAYVLQRAKKLNIPGVTFTKQELENGSLLKTIQNFDADFIVLAGFLLKIPAALIQAFPDRIINIHPSLLPKYGGKGMYGDRVHQAVLEAGENESGITIHLVNEEYDKGRVLFQKSIPVNSLETSEQLASRIHELEHRYFPEVVGRYIREKTTS